jgi:hypothetical protein
MRLLRCGTRVQIKEVDETPTLFNGAWLIVTGQGALAQTTLVRSSSANSPHRSAEALTAVANGNRHT